MNTISILKNIKMQNVFAVFFVVMALFVYTSNTAFACHCQSITASPDTITTGEESTLNWSFAVGEGDVTVTIDELPGQEWTGSVGTTKVAPTETTTYHAHAHKDGMGDVTCSVTVTVKTPEPKVPACPFTQSGNLTVIDFNSGKTRDNSLMLCSNKCSNRDIVKSVNIPEGKYTIQTASWDGYSDRVNVSQPNEQFNMEFRNGDEPLGIAGPTTDLADNVIEDAKIDTFANAITIAAPANKLAVVHAYYPDESSSNSVIPVCVAIKKEVEETPWCEINVNPTSIENGNSANLTWNSGFVTNVDITNIGTNLGTAGNIEVSPTETTTYSGTFYANDGSELTCSATLEVTSGSTQEDGPTCNMSVTPTKVNKGESVTISWTSDNAVSAVIDNGIGEVPLNGDKKITLNQTTTYIGTFSDSDGNKTTCSVKARIKSVGGGSCMNCDTKKHSEKTEKETVNKKEDKKGTPPSIVLGKTIKKTGKNITLDQVPYTGFEAGPVLTTFFWITVLLISGLIAYVLTVFRPFDNVRSVFANKVNGIKSFEKKTNTANISFSNDDNLPGMSHINLNENESADNSDTGDGFGMIEKMAHEENILLSPEALRLIHSKMSEKNNREEYLKSVFDKTKSLYPREDGWILISKDRANELFGKQTKTITDEEEQITDEHKTNPFRVEQRPISNQTFEKEKQSKIENENKTEETNENNNVVDDVIFMFVKKLVEVKKKDVFDLLRNITSKGVDVGSFIGTVVRQLDDVYKHKIEGNHNPNMNLLKLTESWSNEDFETVLGTLVECIDYSYSNNKIGTKIALAKAFDYFERKKA